MELFSRLLQTSKPTMKHYLKNLGADLPAAVVVFLVALPLCLGIALGSDAPLFSGVIAGVVGGIVVGLASGSALSVSGPAAGLSVIVAEGIEKLGVYEIFLLSVVIAGVLQLILGFLRAGILGDYVPNSVIKGMLAAIGIILILKQIPHFIGYDAVFEGDESFKQLDAENTFSELIIAIQHLQYGALYAGLAAMAVLLIWEWKPVKKSTIGKILPGALLAVIFGTLVSELLRLNQSPQRIDASHLVGLPIAAGMSGFLSFFTWPDFSKLLLPQVWITGFTIGIVASLETLLSIEAVDKLDPLKRVSPSNRELKAQGLGNITSGLLGGIPITSVIVRSSANVISGAKTKNSAIFHGVLLLVSVYFIPQYLNRIPLSALAAILIFTGYKLAKISLFKEQWQKGYDQFLPFVVTIVAILFTDLLEGIVIGLFVGLFFMVRSNFRSSVLVVNDENKYLFRLRKDVSFLNKPIVKSKLEEVPPHSYVLIDATRADFIDQDIIETINEFIIHAGLKGIKVEIKKSLHKPMHLNFLDPALFAGAVAES